MSDRPQRDQSDHASEGGRSVRWWESGESGTSMGEDGRKMGDVGDGQKGEGRNEAEVDWRRDPKGQWESTQSGSTE
ncbi:hypothetical protein V496_10454 [Pseudogymnoascus sp. VKM F-4515 (FW-2607)]|nr:hypothetical protein V496_10454 [Pseudogymnoascus sp. VKM F-4515 (FW-2607)]KFY87623.1 hypothetical protein V498_07093 [Pseudogymnoascus sp. VKM F-4517 (FW-2822)]